MAEAGPSRPVQVLGLSSVPARRRHLLRGTRTTAPPARSPRSARPPTATRQLAKAPQAHLARGLHPSARRGQGRDPQPHPQGRRVGCRGGARGRAPQDRRRRGGAAAHHPPRCGCRHRERHQPGDDRQRDRHRLQRPPRGEGAERADREGVDVRFYSVIYQAIDDIETSLKGMLKPEYEEVQLGTRRDPRGVPLLEVRQHRRLDRPVGNDHAQRQGPRHPRWRRRRRQPRHRVAAPVQGRRHRGPHGLRGGIGLGSFNDIQIGDDIETIEMREKPRA